MLLSLFRNFQLVLFILSSFGISSPLYSATCSDDFAADSLMESWIFVDNTDNDDAHYQIENSSLHLFARGADVYNDRNFFAGIMRSDIEGDFDVSVKIISQDKIHPWSQAGILMANNLEDLSEGGYAFISVSEENGARYFWDSEGSVGTTDKNLGDSGPITYPIWIRLEKMGDKVNSYYKQDSPDDWTEIVTDNSPQMLGENSHIALYSFSHDENQTGEVVFDDFNCLHGEFEVSIQSFYNPLKPKRNFSLEQFRLDGKIIQEIFPTIKNRF